MSDKNVTVNMPDNAAEPAAWGCMGFGGLLAVFAVVCMVGGVITGHGAWEFMFSLLLGW